MEISSKGSLYLMSSTCNYTSQYWGSHCSVINPLIACTIYKEGKSWYSCNQMEQLHRVIVVSGVKKVWSQRLNHPKGTGRLSGCLSAGILVYTIGKYIKRGKNIVFLYCLCGNKLDKIKGIVYTVFLRYIITN